MNQKKLNLSCKEATRLMVQREFEILPVTTRVRLQVHLAMCKWCRRFQKQSECLSTALGRIDENQQEILSTEKKEVIASLLNQLKP